MGTEMILLAVVVGAGLLALIATSMLDSRDQEHAARHDEMAAVLCSGSGCDIESRVDDAA